MEALEAVEALQAQMQKLTGAVEALAAQLNTQQTQITQLANSVAQIRVAAVVHPPPPPPAPEPTMPLPVKFSGHRADFSNFRNRCMTYFEVRPRSSGTESQRVNLIKTLLQGDSQSWAYGLPPGHGALTSVARFFDEMATIYSDPDTAATAARKLRDLRQGKRTAEEYAAEFRRWSVLVKWQGPALLDQFLFGLSDTVNDLLVGHPEPETLEEAISLAIRVDRRIRHRKSAKSHVFSPPNKTDTPDSLSQDEPMQIGQLRLDKSEKERRKSQGLCLYCGDKGHFVLQCPKKSQPGNART